MKKYIIASFVAIFTVGFIVGYHQSFDLTNVVCLSFSWKYLVYILLVLLLSVVLSLIGVPIYFLMLVIDIFSGGLVTAFFIKTFFLKGLLFSVFFLLIFKCVFWFFLFLNGFYSLKFIKNNCTYLFYHYLANKNNRKLYFKKMMIINLMIFINGLLIVLLGNKVLIPVSSYLLF